MTNRELYETALRQSAIDYGCAPEDFLSTENKVVLSAFRPSARAYLEQPASCDLTSYGSNTVASVSEELAGAVACYINRFPPAYCFGPPNLFLLDRELQKYGRRVCFTAEYFQPDVEALRPLSCGCEMRVLEAEGFAEYYRPEWRNALCEARRELDVLAAGAFDGGKLVGLAGCSADCETMWQIGVDVLPDYRRRGIASALTARLALEILERGKTPFYCCAWANLGSARNAVRSGFRPAWAQLTAKSAEATEKLLRA